MEQVHLIRHQLIWRVAYIIRLKKSALSGASGVDYSGIDWFTSAIDTNSKYAALCAKGTTCYLVEFSDEILKQADYEFAIYNAK